MSWDQLTLAALLALDIVQVGRLRALLGDVTVLATILATTTTSLAGLGAVTKTMSIRAAVATLDRSSDLTLLLVLRAVLATVAQLCI